MGMQDFEAMRRAMVASQLRTTAVNDPRVVAVMSTVAREAFVPAERAAIAYVDTPVPLTSGRALNTPMATGRLLTEAVVKQGERVLVIGSATGYAAALLARLGAKVVALEEDAALAAHARGVLAGVPGVVPVTGPLAEGWAADAPYDLIFVDGAVEHLPAAIVGQIAEGGRVAAGLVEAGVTRLAIGLPSQSGVTFSAFADVETVVLPGFARPRTFSF